MSKNNISKEVTYFRAETGKGLDKELGGVDRDGGRNGGGIIKGFAVVTRGEALGHDMWLDDEFVTSVGAALACSDKGLKSRYTHPGLSGDGLSKHLGRAYGSEVRGGIAYADLHIAASAHRSPDGDLASHVMDRAEEDPDSFGSSIVFMHDWEAEEAFELDHQDEYEYEDYRGRKRTGLRFKSPDPQNTDNLPHARLAGLMAVDIVDEPAANPNGLFSADETYQEIEGLFNYAIGQSNEKPVLCSLGINPERAKIFVTKYLKAKGYKIMAENENQVADEVLDATENTEELSSETVVEPEVLSAETDPVGDTPKTPLHAEDGKKFIDAFGDKGARWFLEGKSFEDALLAAYQQRGEEIEILNKKIKHLEDSESNPLSSNDGTGQTTKRVGFASKFEK